MLRFAYGAFLRGKLLIGMICMRWSLLLAIHQMVRVHLLVHTRGVFLYNTSDNTLQQKAQINLQNKKKKAHQKKTTGFQFVPVSTSEVLVHLQTQEFGWLIVLILFTSSKVFATQTAR